MWTRTWKRLGDLPSFGVIPDFFFRWLASKIFPLYLAIPHPVCTSSALSKWTHACICQCRSIILYVHAYIMFHVHIMHREEDLSATAVPYNQDYFLWKSPFGRSINFNGGHYILRCHWNFTSVKGILTNLNCLDLHLSPQWTWFLQWRGGLLICTHIWQLPGHSKILEELWNLIILKRLLFQQRRYFSSCILFGKFSGIFNLQEFIYLFDILLLLN